MMTSSPVRAAGWPQAFTLIEVLVSLAIFSLAAVLLGGTYANVLTNYDAVARRNRHDQDLTLLRGIILNEPDRRRVEAGGDLALSESRTAHWEAGVEESRVADLFRINFRVVIRDRARDRPWEHEENFMLLRPTWSDPSARDRLRQAAAQRLAKRTDR